MYKIVYIKDLKDKVVMKIDEEAVYDDWDEEDEIKELVETFGPEGIVIERETYSEENVLIKVEHLYPARKEVK